MFWVMKVLPSSLLFAANVMKKFNIGLIRFSDYEVEEVTTVAGIYSRPAGFSQNVIICSQS